MNLHKLLLTKNECYIRGAKMTPKGIMVHSTGANNPTLRCYVGPDDGLLGANQYGNHWNTYRPGGRQVCVHGFIGKLKDGSIATYQTLPWDMVGWHSGGGKKGSANNMGYIGFEICEDGLTDAAYFNAVYKEAVELCAMLCKTYGIKPEKPTLICHSEGCTLGIASNHADVMHWFPKHGKNMDTFRADVKKAMGGTTSTTKPSTTTDALYRVRKTWADSKTQKGAFSSLENAKRCADKNPGYSVFNSKGEAVYPAKATDLPYLVQVTTSVLNIRKGPGTNYGQNGSIKDKGVYTIVEESTGAGSTAGWGKLKSGAGWISLDYCKKL